MALTQSEKLPGTIDARQAGMVAGKEAAQAPAFETQRTVSILVRRTCREKSRPMIPPHPATAQPPGVWKRRLGLGLLVYSFIPLCTVEVIAFLPVTASQAVTLGVIFIASGEVACLAAIALLGKAFVAGIKEKVKAFLTRRERPSRPRHIGLWRHRLGITLLVGSLAPYYAALGFLLLGRPEPGDTRTLLYLLLAGEGLFFAGLGVLGEEFWARLAKLFEWPGRETATTDGGATGPGRT
ncbi:transporter suffix domain-containing protein [Solidesulfovibrio sp.]|uniref:transporter suffix domain-containing protein n=2 Tax=Solidesulfovibrio sp. TaxID=2910990 RepID=UPI002B1F4206|nr:transporter suffix domain-containing protein [Solidesulfovibrio sp.]